MKLHYWVSKLTFANNAGKMFSALSYFLFSFLSYLCDYAVRYSSDLLNQCIGVWYSTSYFSLSCSSLSHSQTHQKRILKWIVKRMMWLPKLIYIRKYGGKRLEEYFFTAAISEKQKNVGDPSVLDLRGLKSRFNIQADDTVVAPVRFLIWVVLSACLFFLVDLCHL